MTYEEEQIKYAEELKEVSAKIKALDAIFDNPKQIDAKIAILYDELYPTFGIGHSLFMDYNRPRKIAELKQRLTYEYRSNKLRKDELIRLLSQSPSERTGYNIKKNIVKSAEFVASITPQHVSGRVYKVENGDGCGKFCLWFLIIDAIICFIIFLVTGGK